ncbi:hypothetical protein ACFQXB_12240 [Plastorhodobacter daqingensis]|uniref:Histidine kinase n=1 Tax=Plastorhodobacter daqingensis TaxID=1387281 RepID=A0ABW2UN45_9RHOB
MGRLLKLVLFLAVVGFLGLVAYAYLGDMRPTQSEVTRPVSLNVD